jgi:hypothetical protein
MNGITKCAGFLERLHNGTSELGYFVLGEEGALLSFRSDDPLAQSTTLISNLRSSLVNVYRTSGNPKSFSIFVEHQLFEFIAKSKEDHAMWCDTCARIPICSHM